MAHYYVLPLESCGAGVVSDSSYYSLAVLTGANGRYKKRKSAWFGLVQVSTGLSLPMGLSSWLQSLVSAALLLLSQPQAS